MYQALTVLLLAALAAAATAQADKQADIDAVREVDDWRIRLLTWNDDQRKWLQEPIHKAPAAP